MPGNIKVVCGSAKPKVRVRFPSWPLGWLVPWASDFTFEHGCLFLLFQGYLGFVLSFILGLEKLKTN